MRRARILLGLIVAVVVLGLFFYTQQTHNTHTDASASSPLTVGDLSVELQTDPAQIQAGVTTDIIFTLSDSQGNHPLLMTHHARKVHVLIIGEDLNTFAHLHPEDFGENKPQMEDQGKYSVDFTFPKAGTYLLGVDVVSSDGKAFSDSFTVNVKGESDLGSATKDLRSQKCFKGYEEQGTDRYIHSVTTNDSATDCPQGYQVTMTSSSQDIRPGQEVTLQYQIEENGQPVTNLNPYLDAALHLAIVSQDLEYLSHGHGVPIMEGMEMSQEFSHTPAAHDHGSEESTSDHHEDMHGSHHSHTELPSEFGPTLMSEPLVFPKAGIYQVFGQFKHEGKIIFTSFMAEVEKNSQL